MELSSKIFWIISWYLADLDWKWTSLEGISESSGAENLIIWYLMYSAMVTMKAGVQTSPSSLHHLHCLSFGPLPEASQAHPKPSSFCQFTSPFFPVSIPQLSPEGVRKLMVLRSVLTINQAPISQARIKLWTNGYTAMRGPLWTGLYRWRDRTGWRGKLQSRS